MELWKRSTACAVIALALALLTGAVAQAVTLPPDLVSLEQKMAQLKVSSERFSAQSEVIEAKHGAAPKHTVLIRVTGEASESPMAGFATISAFFGVHERIRIIGHTVYEYRPKLARIDGGRPWVRSEQPSSSSEKTLGLGTGLLREHPRSAGDGPFASLADDLNEAQSVVELGSLTVDAQQVTQFNATFDPEPLLKHLARPGPSLSEIFNEKKEPAPAPPTVKPTLTLELFIAANGLPVRTRIALEAEGSGLVSGIDLPAINIPVHVLAPPARLTIAERQVKRLERERQARYRRELQKASRAFNKAARRCRRLPRRRVMACLRAIHLHAPASPPSLV